MNHINELERTAKPLISICIPTRNQEESVARVIESILRQASSCKIEILVNDGSDNQDTQKLIEEIQCNGIVRYQKRIGNCIDQGIYELVKSASGEYIWLIGDDIVSDGALKSIKDCDGVSASSNFIFIDTMDYKTNKLALGLPQDQFFNSKSDLILMAGTGLSFISSCILKSTDAKRALGYAQKYIGTEYLNFALAIRVIAQSSSKLFYLKGPGTVSYPHTHEEIKRRNVRNGTISNNFFEIFAITHKKILSENIDYFEPEKIKTSVKKVFSGVWKGVFVGWVGGWDSPRHKRVRMIKNYWWNCEAWAALFIFILPKSVHKHAYKLFLRYRRFK